MITLQGIAFGRGRWLATGFGGRILFSTDGDLWNEGHAVNPDANSRIVFADSTFLITGDSGPGIGVWTSADGVHWTGRTASKESVVYTGLAFGNKTAVLVTQDGRIYQSDPLPPLSEAELNLNFLAVLDIEGTPGARYDIEATRDLNTPSSWSRVETVTLPTSPFTSVDDLYGHYLDSTMGFVANHKQG